VGDTQITDCGCADVHFALDDKPVCNTVENRATGDYETPQLMRQGRMFFLNITASTKTHSFYRFKGSSIANFATQLLCSQSIVAHPKFKLEKRLEDGIEKLLFSSETYLICKAIFVVVFVVVFVLFCFCLFLCVRVYVRVLLLLLLFFLVSVTGGV